MTFDVFGFAVPPQQLNGNGGAFANVSAQCRHCGLPIVVQFAPDQKDHEASLRSRISNLMQTRADFGVSWLLRINTWPEPDEPLSPAHLPESVDRAFAQGERNYHSQGCEEAAAMMYRRALEVGLKLAYPEMSGMLAARIKRLVAEHHLPAPIGEWADQVKLIGNDGAHEVDGVTRDDLDAQRGFVDMTLRYVFTLPAQVAARRGLPATVA